MSQKRVYLSSPHMGGTEKKYVQEAFDENWIAPLGPNVNNFETELSSYVGGDVFASALSSGTSAIHLALILLGVEPGDEVIASSFTFSATINPIIYQKATPILVDSERETWNMDPNLLEECIQDRISKGKKPKAVLLVHLYGQPAKMEEILEVCARYEIPLIEDAAEALGATYGGQYVGTFGEMGVFSFNGNKIITTSGGGALVGKSKGLIDKSRFLATQARDAAPHYQHTHIGYNYRMSNITAGIGRGQLEVLDQHINFRRDNSSFYQKELGILDIFDFQPELDNTRSNKWLTCLTIDKDAHKEVNREDIRMALEKQNIESRPLWKPMHLQPIFETCPAYLNGVSDDLFDRGLCLPSGSNMLTEDRQRTVDIIKEITKVVVD